MVECPPGQTGGPDIEKNEKFRHNNAKYINLQYNERGFVNLPYHRTDR